MLGFLKKEHCLLSIADGSIMDITRVPDQVFSQKFLGDGFAVLPESGDFVSPCDGTITDVTKTLHAYCITSDDGLEVLVHIGIDTVNLSGKGFCPHVKTNDKVKKGDPLVSADLDLIEKSGFNTTSVVVITNIDRLTSYQVIENPSAKKTDKAMIYKI